MKTVGIIAEYNPFHNGHKFHIEETREITGADHIIAVMSGDFVQRGEPAIFNKWKRSEAAVRSGVDLVLELPVVYACSGAENFAFGAVRLLNSLGCVDSISFGAEADSLKALSDTAEVFARESRELQEKIRFFLARGCSFASARSKAVCAIGMDRHSQIISSPNNILAVEYLKQLIRTKSRMTPVLVERKFSGYYEENSAKGFAGGGKLRELLNEGMDFDQLKIYMPESAFKVFEQEEPLFIQQAYTYVLYRIFTGNPAELAAIDGVFEGLENRAKRAAGESIDYESLIDLIKTKRYSRTSIQRMLIKMLLGIKASDMSDFKECETIYGRVLAFNDRGARLIKSIKKSENKNVEIITNINKESPENPVLKKMLDYDVLASRLYNLIKFSGPGYNSDHRMKPFYLIDNEGQGYRRSRNH